MMASMAQGAWLSVVPIGIVAAGLVFQGALMGRESEAAASGDAAGRVFTAAFLLGPVAETVTGFYVGAIFALGVMRRAGVAGVPAATMALLTLALIPWGGLGPGTAVAAAISGVPGQQLGACDAWIVATERLFPFGLAWYWSTAAGFSVPPRWRMVQLGWVMAVGVSLILWHRVAPWELCGVLATGPLLALRLLLADLPRSARARWHAVRSALPYLLLSGVLLTSRL